MHLAEFIATTLIPTPLEVHSRDARYRCMFNARQSIYLVYIILSVLKFEHGTVVLHRYFLATSMLVTDVGDEMC